MPRGSQALTRCLSQPRRGMTAGLPERRGRLKPKASGTVTHGAFNTPRNRKALSRASPEPPRSAALQASLSGSTHPLRPLRESLPVWDVYTELIIWTHLPKHWVWAGLASPSHPTSTFAPECARAALSSPLRRSPGGPPYGFCMMETAPRLSPPSGHLSYDPAINEPLRGK